jgi:hypothetical protein
MEEIDRIGLLGYLYMRFYVKPLSCLLYRIVQYYELRIL